MSIWRAGRFRVRAAGSVVLALGATAVGAAAVAGPAQAQPVLRLPLRSAAVSWGDNQHGQLGAGSSTGSLGSETYVGVSGLSNGAAQVSAGLDSNSVAVRTDGTVWTWGDGLELGNGSTADSTVPVQVPGLAGVTRVSAGFGFDLALRSDGTVWAWGLNFYGQLGDGNSDESALTPVQVGGLTGVTQIAAGNGFGLALRSDGTVWAWGFNGFGELGDGNTVNVDVPVRIGGLSGVTQIAAGASSAMAAQTLVFKGLNLWSVWTWGYNHFGQLGDGTTTEHNTPEQVAGISVPTVAQIAVGGGYSMVLGSDGSLWGWGENADGEVGLGNTSPEWRPAETMFPNSGITSIAAGYSHVLALRSDGTVMAWGAGLFGSDTRSPSPDPVPGLTGVTQVSAGDNFSLAVHQVVPIFLPGR
jgi:alpha-tubulin suppressor-like RCC1 family protein